MSDLLARTRLTQQLQQDQLDLFRIQDQLSTGRRISLPSDDAPAALRAITLQRLLERKQQVQVNLGTNQSFLAATDNALSSVSSLLADIRGTALGVAGTTSTAQQREAVAQQVSRAIEQLVDIGNQQFRGRYLFAGSRTGDRPYSTVDNFVQYDGNERELRSFSDLDVLFETNITGGEVFGAISEPVQGSIDISPILTPDALLSTLRGGQGISAHGAISVSDGTNLSTIDLSRASTVADVAALIEANPPAGRSVTVDITNIGFSIALDTAGGGNLTITEVAGGNTAKELGIFEETGVLTGPLVGSDLNPAVELTTPLDNLLGTKSSATFDIPGANNDLLIQAVQNGDFNVNVSFLLGATAGSEVVTYTPGGPGTLEIQIQNGVSTAAQIADAINAGGTFTAQIDDRDTVTPSQAGTGTVAVGPTVALSGGSGIDLDRAGIVVTNKDQEYVVDFTDAETVEDLLNEINGAGAGVLAEINAAGNGINLRSRISGADFTIGENGGATAKELGLRTFTGLVRLEELNFGVGVPVRPGADFIITANDGIELDVDVSTAETIQDVLDLINGHPLNAGPTDVVAQLSQYGNGIELIDNSGGVATLHIRQAGLSQAANYLGLIPEDASDATAIHGPPDVLTGRDVNPLEAESVFTTLIRLKNALEAGDIEDIEAAIATIDADISRVTFGRSEVGARQQSLDILATRLEDEQVELKSALSLEIDADLTEAISNLTARQISLEASLRTAANLLQLSVLDFL